MKGQDIVFINAEISSEIDTVNKLEQYKCVVKEQVMGLVNGIHHISMKTCSTEQYNKVYVFYKDILGKGVSIMNKRK